jgi:hypothetical protein
MAAWISPSATASAERALSGGGWRVEPVYEFGVHILEARIEAAGVLADDVDHFAIAAGCLPVFTAGFMHHAKAIVAIVFAGEPYQQIAGGLFRLVELTGMDEVYHGIGCVHEFIGVIAVIVDGKPSGDFLGHAGQVWRGGGRLHGGSEPFAPGRFILCQAALLVLVATSAGARIIASGLGHGGQASS